MQRTLLFTLLSGLGFLTIGQTAQEMSAEFERARKITISYLEAMPADKYSFKPTDDVRSFSEQMLHAAQGTFNLVSNGTGAERKYVDSNLEKNLSFQNKEDVIRLTNESFDYAIESLGRLNETNQSENIKRGPFVVTRYGWTLKALEHLTHHRGQCAVYLRLAGVTPPQYQLF